MKECISMATSARTLRTFLTAITALFALLVFASPTSAAVFPENAPPGTHVQAGTIGCTETAAGVTCTEFELAGVGHTDATVTLEATYTASIQCTNNGGNLVESHDHAVTDATSTELTSSKNGRLVVPEQTSTGPSEADVLAAADCPNPNWTPSVLEGSVTLESWAYTLVLEGFDDPYVLITG
jgi:hypothetical protein